MKSLVFCALFSLLVAARAHYIYVERSEAISMPEGYTYLEKAPRDASISLIVAIKQRNLDKLEVIFHAVSDPTSPQYGQFLTFEQVADLIRPESSNLAKVIQWMREHHIDSYQITHAQDFIKVIVPVSKAEQLLNIQLHRFKHEATGMTFIRTLDPYSVPEYVAASIDLIGGVMRFPKINRLSPIKPKRPLQSVDPSFIAQSFNIPSGTVGKSPLNSQAVAQFLQQYMSPEDLSGFQQTYGLPNQQVAKFVGPNQPNNPGVEATLDIEYITGVAPLVPTWFVYTDGLHEGQEPFLEWIVNMTNTTGSPLVHSISYGDDENSVTLDYANRVNNAFKVFGALGKSILFASGDDGTGCANCTTYVPNFPATSPYVTAVGGIYGSPGGFTADSIASGGFSNYFGIQTWQQTAVQNYLSNSQNNLPPSSFYNSSGRAFPDIASFSEGVNVYSNGSSFEVGGTSCAAPVISAIVSLLNDARLLNGKSQMGFLNYFLYQTLQNHPDAFQDVTQGSNGDDCCGNGFNAAPGWDPITGVGVPNFPALLKYALLQ